jgi:carbonic anhydrase
LVGCSGAPQHADQGGEAEHSSAGADEQSLYALPGLDHGLIQSPVNILTADTPAGRHQIFFDAQKPRADNVSNTGHSIQVNFEPGATTTFDGEIYEFKQCHFHTPSEHQIDGVTYPMEMHCVHTKPAAEGSDAPPEYLVIGFLFKMGEENHFISEFLRQVPETVDTVDLKQGEPVYTEDLLEALGDDARYYTYRGSLTTRPYTETVTWVLAEYIFEASPEQIQTINRLEGNNARHVQALYGRKVEGN